MFDLRTFLITSTTTSLTFSSAFAFFLWVSLHISKGPFSSLEQKSRAQSLPGKSLRRMCPFSPMKFWAFAFKFHVFIISIKTEIGLCCKTTKITFFNEKKKKTHHYWSCENWKADLYLKNFGMEQNFKEWFFQTITSELWFTLKFNNLQNKSSTRFSQVLRKKKKNLKGKLNSKLIFIYKQLSSSYNTWSTEVIAIYIFVTLIKETCKYCNIIVSVEKFLSIGNHSKHLKLVGICIRHQIDWNSTKRGILFVCEFIFL